MLQEAKAKLSSLETHAYTKLLCLRGFLGSYFAACSRGTFQCSCCYRRFIQPCSPCCSSTCCYQCTSMEASRQFSLPWAFTCTSQGPQKNWNIPPTAFVAASGGQGLWIPIWNLPLAFSSALFKLEALPT